MKLIIDNKIVTAPAGALAYNLDEDGLDGRWVYDSEELGMLRNEDPSSVIESGDYDQ